MKRRQKQMLALLAAMLGLGSAGRAAETDCLVRDPSTIVKRNGVYWIYGTGANVQQFSSTDRLHWTARGPVFRSTPPWVKTAVPGITENGDAWAPDIHEFHGTYYLYYCYSTQGSNVSAIGVAASKTLNPVLWVDGGIVVRSPGPDDFNALDPCVFADASGKPWLSFGSYFSGIKLLALDPVTGERVSPNSPIFTLAEHDAPGDNSIEASYVYFRRSWYYLFVNWGGCLAGDRSTYNIRVGRSRSVTGPYLDKDGKDMKGGGGTLFLGSVTDDGSGKPFSSEVGPGHAGIFSDGGQDYFTCHYEWAKDKDGQTTVNLFKLSWDKDGWPSIPKSELPPVTETKPQ